MVYAERKRLRQIEDREAAGESLWTDEIEYAARVKIATGWDLMLRTLPYGGEDQFTESLRLIMQIQLGVPRPVVHSEYWAQITDTDQSLSYLEAVVSALERAGAQDVADFEGLINDVFNSHRIAFRMVEGQFVPLTSDELHVEVVAPTLRLLIDSRFDAAHAAYLKALKEIGHNDPGDAITDAGTALQEAFVALGCNGNSLGPLWKDAKKKGLVVAHDQALFDGISKFVDWASADRSTTGDAHSHTAASREDAWLMVHVVGAIIVRLAQGRARGSAAG